MAITISGENNNDKILASDGVIDQLSGFSIVGVITATSFTGDVTGNLTGNVTGNINNSTLLLQTGSIERLRITSGGALRFNDAESLIHTSADTSRLRLFGGSTNSTANGAALALHGVNHSAGNYAVLAAATGGFLKFSIGTAEKLRIDSSGRVLIGGTSNSASSHADELQVINTSAEGGISIINGDSSMGHIYFGDTSGTAQGRIDYNHGGNYMRFYTADNERLRINSVGSVLVGGTLQAGTNGGLNVEVTDSGNHRVPLALINQGTADNSGIIISHRGKDDAGNQEDYCYIKMVADDTGSGSEDSSMRFWTIGGGTLGERLRIANNGSVTIGKTQNAGKGLEVYQSADAAIRIQNSTTGTGANDGILLEAGASQALVWNYESTPLKFGTAGTERLQIESDGQVVINRTSGAVLGNGSSKLEVYNSTENVIFVANSTAAASQDAGIIFAPANNVYGGKIIVTSEEDFSSSANRTAHMAFYTRLNGTASERLRIDSSGKIKLGSGGTVVGSANVEIRYDNPVLLIRDTAESSADNDAKIGFGNNSHYPVAYMSHIWDGTNGALTFHTRLSGNESEKLRIASNGNVKIGSGNPSGKLDIGDIGSGDIIAELTSGSPTFTYRNGGGSWMHAGKHPTANEFIISEGATTTTVQMLRIQGGGGSNSKFKFPSVESASAHGHSTADVEIGGRHIWKRITSSNHVTTSTSTNHFYLAFWRNESGSQRTCYYKGVVVNVTASGNYDWGGHGYVTHSSQTILAFSSQSGGTARFLINEGYNYINNTSGGTNMKINSVSFSHDSTYLYANFKFTTNISGTGFKPHYNVEVIDPNQCTYTCVAF